VAGASLSIIALYLMTLARLRYEAGVRILPEVGRGTFQQYFLNTATTVFPVGMLCGLATSVLSMLFLPGRRFRVFGRFVIHDYELVTFLLATLLFVLMARGSGRRLVIVMFAVGYSLGAAAIVQLMESRSNNPVFTFAGTTVSVVMAALLVSSRPLMRLIQSFERTISTRS
jgi:hypothetical protein